MSQSPVTDLSEPATLRYKQGWRALNRLLHEDRSFSGRERHCAFLNLGGEAAAFATASAVTGFDFPEDGRGLATVDWDFDGDLDLWLTNRTAPRVRFLKNNVEKKPFVALKLRGGGRLTNRDAIGARVELHLQGAAKHPVRIRSLRGGEGFLSQSSNWMHFALGEAAGIEKVVVRWPGGSVEEVSGLKPGLFYIISEGAGPKVFTPPVDRLPLTASVPEKLAINESVRIVVPPGLPLPPLSVRIADGTEQPWAPRPGRPTVINLWATWCAPCLQELAEWGAQREALTAAGLDVVALNTDGLGDSDAVTPDVIVAALRKAGFPFDDARISAAGLQALDHLNRAVLDRWKPLPLPVTFLLDAHGELTVLYKGPVAAAQLVADAKLSAASATDRRAAAVPFAGRWVDEQASRFDPKRVASLMLDHDESEAAIRYLDVCVASLSPRVNEPGLAAQLGDIHYMAGLLKNASPAHRAAALSSLMAARDLLPKDVRVRKSLGESLFAAGRGGEAAAELAAALAITPADTGLMAELADLYQRLGQYEPSQALLEKLLAANPKDGLTRYHLAGVQVKAGQPQAALPNYRQALRDAPRLLDAANDLARVLAAHPDEAVRSADEAVALARRLCLMSRNTNPQFLDTLGLALAGKGEFSAAAEAVRAAIALLPPADEVALRPLRERLHEYEAGKAVRLDPKAEAAR